MSYTDVLNRGGLGVVSPAEGTMLGHAYMFLRRRAPLVAVLGAALFVASCATQPPPSAYDPPGFFSGLLHGFLIFFSLVGSIFTDTRIYAFPNSGGWYDLGYFLGAATFLGGSGAGSR
jgi:hypothetical protein